MDSSAKRIVLINPPKTDRGRADLTPPLGLLRLASVARESGFEAAICDFNALWHVDPELQQTFYERAIDLLLMADARVYAFTSMCVDSHVAIELARRLKQADKSITIVFGGVHFSSIAGEVKRFFPWVDYVICGEGEYLFADLLSALKVNHPPPSGIFSGDSIGCTPRFRGRSEMLFGPAYDLIDIGVYFALNPRRLVDVESGRGCRFKCTFCYSPGHYSGARDFAIWDVLTELRLLKKMGVNRFALADDNFLNFPQRAMAFCAALKYEGLGFQWQSYATFPQISQQLAAAMSQAGCDRIFCGIDTVGVESQRAFRKAFVSTNDRLEDKLYMLRDHGIVPTCAFLICPPSHSTGGDIEVTLRAALTARLCGAQVRLNTLTLYNGTAALADSAVCLQYDDLRTRVLLDVPSPVERNEFAEAHPTLFPFHSRYAPAGEWQDFIQMAHCVSSLLDTYPSTLDGLWTLHGISPLEVSARVLAVLGKVWQYAKEQRRQQEQIVGYDVLRSLVSGSTANVLESENPVEHIPPAAYDVAAAAHSIGW